MAKSDRCDRCGETVLILDAGFTPSLHGMKHDCGGTWQPVTQPAYTFVENEDAIPTGEICLEDDERDGIVHRRGPDCDRLHGLRIVSRRCSVCGQPWGDGAYSRHERCEILYEGGERAYASVEIVLSDGSQLVMAD